jgi:putative hydrolase of the HAD superfamily
MGMPLEAVVFDLDDTLVVDEAVSKEAMQAVADLSATLHGTDRTEFVAAARVCAQALWKENPQRSYCEEIGISFEECLYGNLTEDPVDRSFEFCRWAKRTRIVFFEAVLQTLGLGGEEAGEELAEAFVAARRRLQRLMPDARETLTRLRGAYRVGLLTNGASSIQRQKISDAGLASSFDEIIVSGEEGIGKPKTEIFDLLLARMGKNATGSAMVGNSLHRDILGARNAGFGATVWIQVAGSEEPADVVPGATIRGLHELPALLAGFAGSREA